MKSPKEFYQENYENKFYEMIEEGASEKEAEDYCNSEEFESELADKYDDYCDCLYFQASSSGNKVLIH